jgi:choline dehydrogenase-like flavoprotein
MPCSFDCVVIGTGVAGCVMAARLSGKSANPVPLVESMPP